MMTYALYGLAAAYLIFGAILTHSMMASMHRRRHPLRDWLFGIVSMPVLFLVGVIFMACEKLWARLLPLLAFEKPEVMRAGPDTAPQRSKDAN
jgi:hypothetical protein